MRTTTEKLESHIAAELDFDRFISQHYEDLTDKSLSEYLAELLEAHEVSKKGVIERTYIDLIYGYQLFNGTRKKPARDILLQIALAFPLTIEETKHLLYYGGVNVLYPRVRRDAYIMFALHNKYSVQKVNRFLAENALDPFKEIG